MPSEFELIGRYFKHPVTHSVLGVGDDGAIIHPAPGMELVISTDMLVAGTHFLPDTDPASLGWKTLAVNLSDMAAMGALPRWALLALALPNANQETWLAAFVSGFFDCAEKFSVDVIGGDTTRGPLNCCVTIMGETPQGKSLLRSGAKPGDEIWISGATGLAALGLAHLQGKCTLNEPALINSLSALYRPQPRVGLGLALRGLASAAIDISDGLLADLGHMLESSGVAAKLDFDKLPDAVLQFCPDKELAQDCLLAGGDDYELLFTAPATSRDRINALSEQLQLALTCIGSIVEGKAGDLMNTKGQPLDVGCRGYDHFANA